MATPRTRTNHTISVAMPPAMVAALHLEARRRKASTSIIVRDAIAAHLGLDDTATRMGEAGRPKNKEET